LHGTGQIDRAAGRRYTWDSKHDIWLAEWENRRMSGDSTPLRYLRTGWDDNVEVVRRQDSEPVQRGRGVVPDNATGRQNEKHGPDVVEKVQRLATGDVDIAKRMNDVLFL